MSTKKPTLNTLQSGIDELAITLKSLVRQTNAGFTQLRSEMNSRFDEVDKKFSDRLDGQESKFELWKSELFTKIDSSYAKPISKQIPA